VIVYAAGKRPNRLLLAGLVAGIGGAICYQFVPAAGPVYLFPTDFFKHAQAASPMPSLGLVPVDVTRPRNCVPSLHVAWVLLLYWYSQGSRSWIRLMSIAFLLLTSISALGFGEHYAVDLVVALPFSLAIYAALSTSGSLQGRAFISCVGAAFLVGWLALLHNGFVGSAKLNILLMLATVAACLVAKSYLDRHSPAALSVPHVGNGQVSDIEV